MAKQEKLREAMENRTEAPVSTSTKADKKDKNQKENWFVRTGKKIGKAFKEMFSELKTVNWPTWKITLTSLVTVLVVVLFFLLVVMGFDSLWAWLLGLLV